ncbi:MAG TPA: hypothetical protein VG347_06215 [Verrucomicrobiae bacterium]|nr:hypothetical protein [Verrucomicrobiae bacterium]
MNNELETTKIDNYGKFMVAETTYERVDGLIAQHLNSSDKKERQFGFESLYCKYYEVFSSYIQGKYTHISTYGRDVITDGTFDRIKRYVDAGKNIYLTNGSLSHFINFLSKYEAVSVARAESRRQTLLTKRFQEIWCVQQEEKGRCTNITAQDTAELIELLHRELKARNYPKTSRVLKAMAMVYVTSGGLQLEGAPRNPSHAAVKKYLEETGTRMSDANIYKARKALRNVARKVMAASGYLDGASIPKPA